MLPSSCLHAAHGSNFPGGFCLVTVEAPCPARTARARRCSRRRPRPRNALLSAHLCQRQRPAGWPRHTPQQHGALRNAKVRQHGPAARTAAGLPQAARFGPHNEARTRCAPSGQLRAGGRRSQIQNPSQSPPPATLAQPAPNRHLPRPGLAAAPDAPHKAQRTPTLEEPSRAQPSRAQPSPTRPAAPPRHLQHHSGPDGRREATPPGAATGPAPPAPLSATRTPGRQTLTGALPAGGGSRRTPRLSPGSAARRRARSSRMRLGASRLAAGRWRAGPGSAGMAAGGRRSGVTTGQARRGAGAGPGGGAGQPEGSSCAPRLRGGPAAVRRGEVAGPALLAAGRRQPDVSCRSGCGWRSRLWSGLGSCRPLLKACPCGHLQILQMALRNRRFTSLVVRGALEWQEHTECCWKLINRVDTSDPWSNRSHLGYWKKCFQVFRTEMQEKTIGL